MDFMTIKTAVANKFNEMAKGNLFTVNLDKDALYALYLSSFPEGTNPIFKERTEHDCNCCKSFIRAVGNVVSIVDNKVTTIWDVECTDPNYQVVADALAAHVKSKAIDSVFLSAESKAGTDKNHSMGEDGQVLQWTHFFVNIPQKFVKGYDLGEVRGRYNEDKGVFKRSVSEISLEAIDIVIELIEQDSLYRGAEHLKTVKALRKEKVAFDKVAKKYQDNYCWEAAARLGSAGRYRNTVIGTLLCDISDGVDLDKAVKSFEAKVAPSNYKRSSAVVTQGMIQQAQKKVEELGLMEALPRRYAVVDDISINDILHANRNTKKAMNVFDEMAKATPKTVKNLDKVEEVSVKDFIEKILPKADELEVMVENRHTGNLFSLIAPECSSAPNILKWDNNFSWTYNGEVTDSIKERVKAAGGQVDAELRISLSWTNSDDLDLSVVEPDRTRIYFGNKTSVKSGGRLDVDMNAFSVDSRTPVENIFWKSCNKMLRGSTKKHKIIVNNFRKRENVDVGFTVEVEYNGAVKVFNYPKALANGSSVTVGEFHLTKDGELVFSNTLPEANASKQVWGINTMNFQKVNMVMKSPNYWGGQEVGNEHLFFVLDGCHSGEGARGIYNEFLRNELTPHRKVFEMLGSKMRVPESDEQLSGVGFSSTKRDSIVCKVTGSFNRVIKINF